MYRNFPAQRRTLFAQTISAHAVGLLHVHKHFAMQIVVVCLLMDVHRKKQMNTIINIC
jgi:hypothetical protein